MSVFGKTDLGRTRDHNEDTFLVADLSTGNASLHPRSPRHEVGPRGSLFMVADGMGGAAAGELASAMAADLIYRHLATAWAADDDASPERFAFRMKEAVELANQQIYGYAREHPEVRGHGHHGDRRRASTATICTSRRSATAAPTSSGTARRSSSPRTSRSCSGWWTRAS